MRTKLKSAVTVGALVAAAGAAMFAGAGSASAQGTPTPWAPGGISQDGNAVGGLEFFTSAGVQVTSGNINDVPFAKYVVGLAKTRTVAWTDTTATLYAYVPAPGQTPDQWTVSEQLGGSPSFPAAGAPGAIGTTSLPVYTGSTAFDESLAALSGDIQQTSTTAGYVNAYELRIYTGAAGHSASTTYDYADITINNTTGQWALVYSPDQAGTSTSTTIDASTPTTATTGTPVTLKADVTGGAAGTVQFFNGATAIGTPQTVTAGAATLPWTFTSAGTAQVNAKFTPTALSGFAASASGNYPVAVTGLVVGTSVSEAHTFTGTVGSDGNYPAFSPATLTATVTPGNVAGSVAFFDGSTQVGPSVSVPGTNPAATPSTVSTTYSLFAPGAHSLTAKFTPTDTTDFTGSTSTPADTFTLGAAAGPTPDIQSISVDVPNGSLSISTPYHAQNPLNVTLALNSAGTELTGNTPFGSATGGPTDPLQNTIKIVDTRTGGLNWTASAIASSLSSTTTTSTINGENVGLTNLSAVPIAGNHLTSSNIVGMNNPAADPAVASSDTGTLGLGNTSHVVVTSNDPINGGTGTIGVIGTLTVNAPTSTLAGHYTGTITFTIV